MGIKMKRFYLSAVAAVFAMTAGAASADVLNLHTRKGFEIGGSMSGYEYKEPGVMQETGTKWGVTGNATAVSDNLVFLRGEGRFAFGPVDYSSPESGTATNDINQLWEIRAVAGKDFNVEQFVMAPFAGLGYRNLYDDMRGVTSSGAVGYRRDSQYLYIPLGVTSRFALSSAARLSVTAEYDVFLRGRQKSYLGDAGSASCGAVPCSTVGTINNTQNSGYGVRFAVAYETVRWSVGPFVNYWNIDQSDMVLRGGSLWYEPQNHTWEAGIQAAYHF